MAVPSHIFDELTAWAHLDPLECASRFSPESAETLAACAALLLPDPFSASQVTPSSFSGQVSALYHELQAGSHALGEALISAGRLEDGGSFSEASQVLTAFLGHCTAPFYRGVASSKLAQIRSRYGT